MDALFSSEGFHVSRTHWKTALDFEHHMYKGGSSHVFVGWHNIEFYAVRPTDQERFYVSSALPERTGLETGHFLLVTSLPMFA